MRTTAARAAIAAICILAALAVGTAPAAAQASRLGATFNVYLDPVPASPTRFSDVAFDNTNQVYLLVWGMYPVMGKFVDAAGTPLGTEFVISDNVETLAARTAYSPQANAFLVTWLDERVQVSGNSARVAGRLVRYQAGGTPSFVTAAFTVNQNGAGKYPDCTPNLAYSPTSQEFLVTWVDFVAGAGTDVRGQRVGIDGALRGAELSIAGTASIEMFPAVAYNPDLNQFAVAYMWETDTAKYISMQLVTAGSGAFPRGRSTLSTALFENYPEIQYSQVSKLYTVIWYQFAPGTGTSGDVYGIMASSDGEPSGAVLPVAASVAFEGGDGLGLAYQPLADVSFAVFQGDPPGNAWGIDVSGAGTPAAQAFQITNVADTGTAATLDVYNPRIAANSVDSGTKQWLAVTTPDFNRIVGQRIQTTQGAVNPSLPAPTNLTATPAGGTLVNIAWVSGGGTPSDFRVERSVGSTGSWSEIGSSMTTTYGDTGAACGATYHYRVRAHQQSDNTFSAYSATATAVTEACAPMPIVIDPNLPSPWYFAEGVTSPYLNFETCYQAVNPNAEAVNVRFYFSAESGNTYRQTLAIAANAKLLVCLGDPNDVGVELPPGPYGVVAHSMTAGRQVYLSRQVFWGADWEGSTLEAGSRTLSRTWYFAEGSRNSGFFENYFTVFNPTSAAGTVTLTFFRDDGQTVVRSLGVGAQTRVTFNANDVAELANTSFSTTVTSTVDVVAERAMYWGPNWMGGHCSIGITSLSPTWYFAEGAVAPGFDTYYLLFNPNDTAVTVSITYYGNSGVITTKTYPVQARKRLTLDLRNEVGLINPVSASIATLGGEGIIVERSTYWGSGGFPNWVDGTNSLGSTATDSAWFLPEGDISTGYDTYVLVTNPGVAPVSVTFTVYPRQTGGVPPSVGPFSWTQTILANARSTVWMNEELAKRGVAASYQSFSVTVASSDGTSPISVEEAFYWKMDGANYWRAGSVAPGIRR